jgi:hypothetical protein
MRIPLTLLAILIPTAALGHGSAEWIQKGKYSNANGIHCCGPADCFNLGQAELHRIEGGWEFEMEINGEMTKVFAKDSSVFSSQDANVWACKSVFTVDTKEVRCLFIPGNA